MVSAPPPVAAADPTVWTESKHQHAIESDHDPRHFLAGENRLQTVLYLRRSLEAAQLVAWALSQRLRRGGELAVP